MPSKLASRRFRAPLFCVAFASHWRTRQAKLASGSADSAQTLSRGGGP